MMNESQPDETALHSLLLVLTPLLSVSSSLFQSHSAESHSSPLVRRYKDGEMNCHMAASNQVRNQAIRYEADTRSSV
jgi:hypothetical protein